MKDSLSMQLAWVRWLLNNNRTAEALAKLSDLENRAGKEEERRKDEQKFRREYMGEFSETEGRVFWDESIQAARQDFPALKL